jgi:hypothetical protein
MDLAPEDVVTAAGRGDLPLPLYIVFVVVGLLVGAVLVTLLVTALVTIVQARWLSLRGKVGWVVGCLVFPFAMPASWHIYQWRVERTGGTEARQVRAGPGMREFAAGLVDHPELDFDGEGFAATETRSPVVFLDAGRVSFLETARDAGKRAVLVTDEISVLTPALASVWQEPDAAWVVRSTAGLRDGFTGRRLTSVGDVLTAAPVQAIDDVAVDFLRPSSADAVQVNAVVSVRHGTWETTQLGGPAAALAELTTGSPLRLWGPYEPLGRHWDRVELTKFAREQAPGPARLLMAARGLAVIVQVRSTRSGLEEMTEAHVSLGAPSPTGLDDQHARLLSWLTNLADTAMPLAGLVLARRGRDDLLAPSRLTHRPAPIAFLIGPPAVDAMKVDVDDMVARFGAIRVGRPNSPGALFRLGGLDGSGWERLGELLDAVGREQLATTTGLSLRHLRPPASVREEPS